jgi:hypothetical protein
VLSAVVFAASSDGGGEGLKVFIPLAVAAAGLFGVLLTLIFNVWLANRERRRDLYAGGSAAVQSYKEMAFAIRRRNVDDRAAERVRLSEAMREIQRDLSFHEALIGRERPGAVAAAYRELSAETRRVAGGIIKRSWDEEPVVSDREMHAPEIAEELGQLRGFEDAYLNAVAKAVGGRRDPRS